MRNFELKTKLANKELTIGSWLSFGYYQTCEIMARAGFDWLVIDMEHTTISLDQCLNMIRIIESNGVCPLVRVGQNDSLLIKQVMDAGAHGIVVPMVNSADDAQKAVNALYYPPIGERGVGLGRAHGYGIEFEEYRQWAEKESILIVQIEHINGVRNLEDIMSVKRVDGFIVGPYDLSGSLGLPGKWEDQKVKSSLTDISDFGKADSKPGGYHVVHGNQDELRLRISEGYRFIAYGDDMVFFSDLVLNEKRIIEEILKS